MWKLPFNLFNSSVVASPTDTTTTSNPNDIVQAPSSSNLSSFSLVNSSNQNNSTLNSKTPAMVQLQGPIEDFRILIILDASGSMSDIRQDMIGSINEFLVKQKQASEEQKQIMRLTMVQFNDNVKYVKTEVDLNQVQPVTAADYQVTGNTALYDAIGNIITGFQDCPNVSCVIVTDGQENSSRTYTHHQIIQLIEQQKTKYNWDFIYMSQDANGFKQGTSLGVTSNFVCSKSNFGETLSNGISNTIIAKSATTNVFKSTQKPQHTS